MYIWNLTSYYEVYAWKQYSTPCCEGLH